MGGINQEQQQQRVQLCGKEADARGVTYGALLLPNTSSVFPSG